MHTKRAVCDKIADIIEGPRDNDYGDFAENMEHTAALFTAYLWTQLKTPITSVQACDIISLIKFARTRTTPLEGDHHLDKGGYAVGAFLCSEAEEARNSKK